MPHTYFERELTKAHIIKKKSKFHKVANSDENKISYGVTQIHCTFQANAHTCPYRAQFGGTGSAPWGLKVDSGFSPPDLGFSLPGYPLKIYETGVEMTWGLDWRLMKTNV